MPDHKKIKSDLIYKKPCLAAFMIWLPVLFLMIVTMDSNAQQKQSKSFFTWQQLKQIPDADGFAGSYAGISGNTLLLAGGANFPKNGRPWANGVKTWFDDIFILEQTGGDWKRVGKLPRPMAYGVSLTYKDNVICLDGGDARQNYTDAFLLKYSGGKIITESLPSMPVSLINACGVLIQDALYLAGGIETPASKQTTNHLKIIGLFGGCLAGMFLAGIFFKRIHGTGIMIGFFISAVLLYFVQAYTNISFYLYPAVAILGCTLFGYIFSILLPPNKIL